MPRQILYLSDLEKPEFEQAREQVQIVCAGDSITGWNNAREMSIPTYPQYLQELVELQLVDAGIAGQFIEQGIHDVRRYISLFPNAKQFIVGYGTNDLGMSGDNYEFVSSEIMRFMEGIIWNLNSNNIKPILINVPNINSRKFSRGTFGLSELQREYHNSQLEAYCKKKNISLVDICSKLKDKHFHDALHPNSEGARVIAQEIYKLI